MQVVTVARLDEHVGTYRFEIIHRPTGESFVCIPGHGGGRDGPTDPDHPEQEAWMRAHAGLKEVWYLTWQPQDDAELSRFLRRLDEAAGGGVLGAI